MHCSITLLTLHRHSLLGHECNYSLTHPHPASILSTKGTKQGEAPPMSFTADELQSFNDILDKKLSVHRLEMERVFDQRLQTLRRELDRRLSIFQQEIIQTLPQRQSEQQGGRQNGLNEKPNTHQPTTSQATHNQLRRRPQQPLPQ